MNTPIPASGSSIATLVRQVIRSAVPDRPARALEAVVPTLTLKAYQLGVNVLLVERRRLSDAEAVRRPEILTMVRVHSGASLLLQEQLPGEMREILTGVLNGLVQQNLESAGGFMFAVASRRNHPEAAFWRYLALGRRAHRIAHIDVGRPRDRNSRIH